MEKSGDKEKKLTISVSTMIIVGSARFLPYTNEIYFNLIFILIYWIIGYLLINLMLRYPWANRKVIIVIIIIIDGLRILHEATFNRGLTFNGGIIISFILFIQILTVIHPMPRYYWGLIRLNNLCRYICCLLIGLLDGVLAVNLLFTTIKLFQMIIK